MTFGDDRKPRVGSEITYRGKPQGRVTSVDGNLCWVRYYEPVVDRGVEIAACPFIWRFPREEKLNSLHDWPGKSVEHGEPIDLCEALRRVLTDIEAERAAAGPSEPRTAEVSR